jgi:hypothetical protein
VAPEAAREHRAAAAAAASAAGFAAQQQAALLNASIYAIQHPGPAASGAGQKRSFVRMQADSTWVDESLAEWPENDFRLYVTDLGNEATDDMLAAPFRRFRSFVKARVVRDKHNPEKCKGYGFVSLLDPWEALAAMKEVHGKYIGSRPVKVQRSHWSDKQIDEVRRKEKEREKRRLEGGAGGGAQR